MYVSTNTVAARITIFKQMVNALQGFLIKFLIKTRYRGNFVPYSSRAINSPLQNVPVPYCLEPNLFVKDVMDPFAKQLLIFLNFNSIF